MHVDLRTLGLECHPIGPSQERLGPKKTGRARPEPHPAIHKAASAAAAGSARYLVPDSVTPTIGTRLDLTI